MVDQQPINCRDLVKTSGVAAASVLLAGSISAATVTPLAHRRYAMIGTGHSGGDDRLRDLIFKNVQVPDHLKLPDSRAGACPACPVSLPGLASSKSVRSGSVNC